MQMTSLGYYDNTVLKFVLSHCPDRNAAILDIGCGYGKYHTLLSPYFKNIDAIEVCQSTIDNYQLTRRYRNIMVGEAKNIEYGDYDVVIMGDVIEHMTVEDARKVIEYACTKARVVIVVVPWLWEQRATEENPFDEHIQPDLTPQLMAERYPMLTNMNVSEQLGLYVKIREGG